LDLMLVEMVEFSCPLISVTILKPIFLSVFILLLVSFYAGMHVEVL
jgi:hypothetical protein